MCEEMNMDDLLYEMDKQSRERREWLRSVALAAFYKTIDSELSNISANCVPMERIKASMENIQGAYSVVREILRSVGGDYEDAR